MSSKRKQHTLEHRRFTPATRPLNRRELREYYLDKYEDSLEAKKPLSVKRKKKQKAARAAEAVEL